MGMSHDFEIAIEEGATLVRVGTAIFGERSLRPRSLVQPLGRLVARADPTGRRCECAGAARGLQVWTVAQ
jgi:hypothetical protein